MSDEVASQKLVTSRGWYSEEVRFPMKLVVRSWLSEKVGSQKMVARSW